MIAVSRCDAGRTDGSRAFEPQRSWHSACSSPSLLATRRLPKMRTMIAAVSLLAFGCTESVESNDVRTSGIYPEITVTGTGNGSSTVSVRLKVGGSDSNTFLDLKGDDELKATVDGETKTLDGSGNTYQTTFGTDAEGTEFTVAFLRGDQDDDAPESTVTMPAPFDLMLAVSTAGRGAD